LNKSSLLQRFNNIVARQSSQFRSRGHLSSTDVVAMDRFSSAG